MMKINHLFLLLFISGCATKYIIPGNRFMTPETQGGVFRGEVEIQQARANLLMLNAADGGVVYTATNRTGFMYSNSFFENFDLFWSHVGGGNSLIGGKFQIVGDPKASRGAGHKLAVSASIGANEHESDMPRVEFELGGNELMLIYGYRINEMLLPYASFSYARYTFNILGGDGSIQGLGPRFRTTAMGLNGGFELMVGRIVAKLEGSYQELASTETRMQYHYLFGWSLGYSW